MPNFVKNKIIVGKSEFGKILIDKYTTFYKETIFDFNKVIKMPKELMIEFSTKSNLSLALYLTYINPYVSYFGKKKDKIDCILYQDIIDKVNERTLLINNFVLKEYEIDSILQKFNNKKEELLNLGKRQVDNLLMYNVINWYEWSVFHWGTKWNASNFNVSDDYKSITFETAWNPAKEVILEISKQNPEMKFGYLYSDENIGSNVGYLLLQNGIIDYAGTFEDDSVDAYMLAFDLWECRDEFMYDEKKKTYIRKDLN